MKPTTEFDATLLDNASAFDGAFYRRFHLRHAPKPLELAPGVTKNYLFPTFYGDVTCAMGIFLCSYERAERMMMHPRIKPVRMTRGRAIVAFSCYEYKQVLGVAPYNEIAMTIPIMVDPMWNPPVVPMLGGRMPGFGYYVFSMPVTSLENQIRGRRIWGLPKVVEEIDVREAGRDCVTTAFDAQGSEYFRLRVPTSGASTRLDVRSNLYSTLDGRLLRSETCFAADFAVNKHPAELFRAGRVEGEPYLTFGASASGRVLAELDVDPVPLELRFARHMTSCFDLPDPAFRSPAWF